MWYLNYKFNFYFCALYAYCLCAIWGRGTRRRKLFLKMCSNFAFDSSVILQISEIGHLNKDWSFWKNQEKGKKQAKQKTSTNLATLCCEAKGQLISKCLFGIFNSPKKRTKKFNFTTKIPQVDLFSFLFWEKLKTFRN